MATPDAATALATMTDLADHAREVLRAHLGAPAATKADGTPVTAVDTELNRHVLDVIADRHPSCGVLGEELSSADDDLEALFVVDPVDGTAQFTAGVGLATFAAAYVLDGRPVAAVVDDPWADRRYTALGGVGAFCNGDRISVGPAPRASICTVEATRGTRWEAPGVSLEVDLRTVGLRPLRMLAFIGPACRVADGAYAGAVFARPSIVDTTAPALVVAEAGGVAVTLDGAPIVAGHLAAGAVLCHPGAYATISAALEAAPAL